MVQQILSCTLFLKKKATVGTLPSTNPKPETFGETLTVKLYSKQSKVNSYDLIKIIQN